MNFTEMIAKGLRLHCEYWGYDDIEKLKEDISVQNFCKLFCKVTNTYFINDSDDYFGLGEGTTHYEVVFDKKGGTATVKRCGRDWDERGIDATVKIEDVIKLLVQYNGERRR